METLFNDLQNHLATHFGERISLIDEDYGQLDLGFKSLVT